MSPHISDFSKIVRISLNDRTLLQECVQASGVTGKVLRAIEIEMAAVWRKGDSPVIILDAEGGIALLPPPDYRLDFPVFATSCNMNGTLRPSSDRSVNPSALQSILVTTSF